MTTAAAAATTERINTMKTANKDYELATIDKNAMSNDYSVDSNNRLDSLGKTPVRNEGLKIEY